MKLTFLRAMAFASLTLFAFGTVPAHAEDGPKLSRTASKLRQETGKLMDAKDWTAAIAKLREVLQTEGLEDYDKFVFDYDLAYACYSASDITCAADAYVEAAKIKGMPDDKHTQVVHNAMRLLTNGKDYQHIVDFAKEYLTDAMMNDMMARILSAAYYQLEDFPNALRYGQKSIDLGAAAGSPPERDRYNLILSCYVKLKDQPAQIKTVDTMAKQFGTSEDWQRAIDLALGSLPAGDKNVAALFLYRLRLITKADSTADDYQTAASLGLDPRLPGAPGDAVAALTAAQATGNTNGKTASLLAKAKGMAASDQKTLSAAKAEVAKSRKPAVVVRVAEAYFSYGQYAEAEEVAKLATDQASPKKNELLMLVGAAQAMQGENDAAAATFAMVKGDGALEKTAHVWILYATRTYDKPKAEPAPAQ